MQAIPQHQVRSRRLRAIESVRYLPFMGDCYVWSKRDHWTDADHTRDIEHERDHSLVYWTDASLDVPSKRLGAAVVYHEEEWGTGRKGWRMEGFPLGTDTGTIDDAELYGIAMALRLAADRVKQCPVIKRVRIFTDNQNIPIALLARPRDGMMGYGGTGRTGIGGPDNGEEEIDFAIVQAHEKAYELSSKGVKVELMWIKGHAQSAGNHWADTTAKAATRFQSRFSNWVSREDRDQIPPRPETAEERLQREFEELEASLYL